MEKTLIKRIGSQTKPSTTTASYLQIYIHRMTKNVLKHNIYVSHVSTVLNSQFVLFHFLPKNVQVLPEDLTKIRYVGRGLIIQILFNIQDSSMYQTQTKHCSMTKVVYNNWNNMAINITYIYEIYHGYTRDRNKTWEMRN